MELDVNSNLDALQQALTEVPGLELAVLIGSRATGKTTSDSDWDIAIQWGRDTDFLTQLADTEVLRRALAHLLGVGENKVDLIDLPTAGLAMRAAVAEEGILLKGDNTLPWHHFLKRTWRELEEYYWEQTYCDSNNF